MLTDHATEVEMHSTTLDKYDFTHYRALVNFHGNWFYWGGVALPGKEPFVNHLLVYDPKVPIYKVEDLMHNVCSIDADFMAEKKGLK